MTWPAAIGPGQAWSRSLRPFLVASRTHRPLGPGFTVLIPLHFPLNVREVALLNLEDALIFIPTEVLGVLTAFHQLAVDEGPHLMR